LHYWKNRRNLEREQRVKISRASKKNQGGGPKTAGGLQRLQSGFGISSTLESKKRTWKEENFGLLAEKEGDQKELERGRRWTKALKEKETLVK